MAEFTTATGDQWLHEEILREGSCERALEETRRRARQAGWSEEAIERAYGKPANEETKLHDG